MKEFLVYTNSGPMKIAAKSLEEAEAIARKDGHTVRHFAPMTDATFLVAAHIEKLEDDREALVECLNDLVSSGELSTTNIMKIDAVLAETIGRD